MPQLTRLGTGLSRNRERYVPPLRLILGLTVSLLLLACVNLGGLLLARLTARSSELAVRLALGGTRLRVAQQMLIESLVLSLSGAALGVPLAFAIVSTLASFMPPVNVAYTMSFTPDLRVLAVTSLVAVSAGVLMSALPIWMALRRRSGGHFTWDRRIAGTTGRWGRGLLVAQVALSVVMVIGAGLLTRSLYLLQHTDLGVRTEGILNIKTFALPNAPYTRSERASYYPPLMERIAALPGVRGAALASNFPRVTTFIGTPIAFAGGEHAGLLTSVDCFSPTFFATMGIPVLAGRVPGWSDTLDTRRVAIVSESLARMLSPDGHVLERHIKYGPTPADQDIVIVGVVGDATQGDPRHTRRPVLYRPVLQLGAVNALNPNLLIDTADPATAAAGVRQILAEFGQHYPQEVISVADVLARAPATERMTATVAAAVGGLALVLALIGVHGVLAYSVSRRRREIGVRLAIGATPVVLARAVVREAFLLTAVGVALGVPAALVAARSLRSLMFGISEADVATFAAATVFFLTVGGFAGLMPARRAAPLVSTR